ISAPLAIEERAEFAEKRTEGPRVQEGFRTTIDVQTRKGGSRHGLNPDRKREIRGRHTLTPHGSGERAVKEIAGRVIRLAPRLMEQKIVDLVRKDELLDVNTALAQPRDEVHRLSKVNVAIVIAVNEEHRRFPTVDGGDGRRIVRELGELRRDIFAVPVVGGPIVYAVKVDTRREEIRVSRKAQRGEVTTVAAAPQADTRGVHVGSRLQIFPGSNYVLIFTGTASGAAGSFAERAAISDAAAIVHREDDVAAARKILVHGVGI